MKSRPENVNGHYILYARNIGSGSLGTVYVCQKNGKQWAVKIISKQKIGKDPRQLERFQDEVSIGMEDNGQNVIKIVALGQDLHNWYIFMDLCLQKLNKLFEKGIALRRKSSCDINADIERLQNFSFQKDYAQVNLPRSRDLTPSNILLSQNGEYLISDLGMCKQNFLKSFIHQASFISTPKYQSIQHFTSNYSSKCDVWSLSLIFYQLLHSGKFPYIFNSIEELHERIKHQKIQIRQDISKQAIDFLKKGLQPYQKDRMSVRSMLKHPLFKDMLFTVKQKLAQEVLFWLAQLIKKKQLDIFEILQKLKLSSEEWLNSLQIQELLKYLLDSSIDQHQIETFFKVYKSQQKNAIHRAFLIDEIFRVL